MAAKLFKIPTGYVFQTDTVEVQLSESDAKGLIDSALILMHVEPNSEKDAAWLANREEI